MLNNKNIGLCFKNRCGIRETCIDLQLGPKCIAENTCKNGFDKILNTDTRLHF